MRSLLLQILCYSWYSHAVPLVDLPEVTSVVDEALGSLAEYTAYAGPTEIPQSNSSAKIHAVVHAAVTDPSYWLKDIAHQGYAAFNSNPSGYAVFRNVKDYGAIGDGSTDDTAAINSAISAGGRCGPTSHSCQSSTVTPAIVYFPAGTYVISSPIIDYYMTQIIGNPNSLPVIKATAGFSGLGLIDGDQYQSDGNQGWTSTNIFFRQIRNLILDLTNIPASSAATGIHWPTGQATSIENVQIKMTVSSTSQHQGLFIENGSGGWLSDVTITGGLYGANIGNQQFSMRNLVISNAVVGISQIWDWGWTYQGITISNCGTAFSMTGGGSSAQAVGSVTILDSTITGCTVFVDTVWTTSSSPASAGSLILENIQLNNVPTAVKGPSSTYLAGTTGSMTISGWGQGHKYTPSGPTNFQGSFTPVARPSNLLASGSTRYYTKSKPQYVASPVASFVSMRSAGAKGDGSTDDTTVIQNTITSAASSGKIVFFDHGVYKVTKTIYIPPGSRIVGETFSVIMASGSLWSDVSKPYPVIQVGKSGESGSVEWSDMVISTQGSTPGAVLIEWNLAASSGSGMWDVHTRIGGFKGSNLQVAQCPTGAAVSTSCMAAYMSMHITSTGTGAYIENCWFWTADHDLDDSSSTRISVYTGRGLLVEANRVWLYGTGVEHHALYQYHFANTKNVVAGFIQTETPYWQPKPNFFNQPYSPNTTLYDPNFTAHACLSGNCDALGLRIYTSTNIFIYGAGLYSFFNNYDTSCSDFGGTANCQSEIVAVDKSSSLRIYTLNTIGSQSMMTIDGVSYASYADNVNVYPDTIALFSN